MEHPNGNTFIPNKIHVCPDTHHIQDIFKKYLISLDLYDVRQQRYIFQKQCRPYIENVQYELYFFSNITVMEQGIAQRENVELSKAKIPTIHPIDNPNHSKALEDEECVIS
jgi:hypothetical protein